MIFSFLIQLFFQFTFQDKTLGLQQVEAVSAQSDKEPVVVEGYSPVVNLSYKHSLPQVLDGGFGPQRKESESLGVLTTAESVAVIDERTSKVLFEKSINDQRSIASITKLMTAMVLLDLNLDFNQTAIISASDYRAGGKIQVYTGEEFFIKDLWMDALIASDNVAIMALVRYTGVSNQEFVELMNKKAKELGLEKTSFVEPTGIHSGNVSTALELAKILEQALGKDEIKEAVSKERYEISPIGKDVVRVIENTNKLLDTFVNQEPYKLVGGKTGFIYEAGYCLAVIVDGPNNADDIIIVLLGADSIEDRFLEVKGLVDWTYENYIW